MVKNSSTSSVNVICSKIDFAKSNLPFSKISIPTSFFTFQPVDASGNSLGNSQTIYDFDQTIASRLDEMMTIQNHLSKSFQIYLYRNYEF